MQTNVHFRRPARFTPGSAFLEVKKGEHNCATCKSAVLVAQVRDPHTSTVKWKNFDRTPIESGAHRVYRRHLCPR